MKIENVLVNGVVSKSQIKNLKECSAMTNVNVNEIGIENLKGEGFEVLCTESREAMVERIEKSNKLAQYRVYNINISELGLDESKNVYVAPAKEQLAHTLISESRAWREYGVKMEDADGEFNAINDFVIFDFKPTNGVIDNPLMVLSIVAEGFEFDGHMFKETMLSASQGRTGKGVFSRREPSVVRERMTYGATFPENVVMSKVITSTGLCLTSDMEVGSDFTHTIIEDHKRTVKIKAQVWNHKEGIKVSVEEVVYSHETTDGMGTISPLACAKVALRYKSKLSQEEYDFFVANFKSISSIKKGSKLERVFNKIPRAYQIRYAGAKGLLVMFDHAQYGYDQDICFTNSMWKYTPDFSKYPDIPLEIVNISKRPKKKASTNYQFLQCLDVTAEDIIARAKELLDEIDNGIFVDPVKAMKFLGMVNDIGSEEDMSDKLLSKTMHTLHADPTMIDDKKIQDDLRRLVRTYVEDVQIGRIPVEGAFVFVATDPHVLFGAESDLKEGEFHYNGLVGDYAGFRSPMNHVSEVGRLKLVTNKKLAYLNDVIVCNPYGDHALRMGGMDFDGDKILITNDPMVMKSLPAIQPPVYRESLQAKSVALTEENIQEFFVNSSVPSDVGKITNLATVLNDIGRHNKNTENSDKYVAIVTCCQGYEIDKIKTGKTIPVPEALKTKYLPHWLADVKRRKGQEIGAKIEIYTSASPLGKLFDFVGEYLANLKPVKKTSRMKMTLKFTKHIDKSIADEITPYIIKYEDNYRKALASIGEKENAGLMTKENADDMRELVYNKYTGLMKGLKGDEMTKAGIAYHISYNVNSGDSISFPWVTCFDGLLQLLYKFNSAEELVRIPAVDSDTVEIKYSYMLSDRFVICSASDIKDGEYPVLRIEDTTYIVVPSDKQYEYTPTVQSTKSSEYEGKVEFMVKGFKYQGIDSKQFVEILMANRVFDIVEDKKSAQLAVFSGGRRLGMVSLDDRLGQTLGGLKMLFHSNEPITYFAKGGSLELKGALRIIAQPIGQADEINVEATSACVVDTDEMLANHGEYMAYGDDYATHEIYEDIDVDTAVSVVAQTPAEEVIADDVFAKLNSKAPYWATKSLVKPASVDKYEAMIINASAKVGQTIGEITAFKGDTGYKFTVVRTETGLSIESKFGSMSQEFCYWVYRVISYKSAERRIRG